MPWYSKQENVWYGPKFMQSKLHGKKQKPEAEALFNFLTFFPLLPPKALPHDMSCLCRFLPCRMWNHLTFCMGNINRLVPPFYWKIMADRRFFFFFSIFDLFIVILDPSPKKSKRRRKFWCFYFYTFIIIS